MMGKSAYLLSSLLNNNGPESIIRGVFTLLTLFFLKLWNLKFILLGVSLQIIQFLYPHSLWFKCTTPLCYDMTMFSHYIGVALANFSIYLTVIVACVIRPDLSYRIVILGLCFYTILASMEFLVYASIVRMPLVLTNRMMHSLNGNISDANQSRLLQVLSLPFSRKNSCAFIYSICDGKICNFENLKYFRNIDFINYVFDSTPRDNLWNDYAEFILQVFSLISVDPTYLSYYDPFLGTIENRFRSGWQSHLLTNSGMHSTNGNIDFRAIRQQSFSHSNVGRFLDNALDMILPDDCTPEEDLEFSNLIDPIEQFLLEVYQRDWNFAFTLLSTYFSLTRREVASPRLFSNMSQYLTEYSIYVEQLSRSNVRPQMKFPIGFSVDSDVSIAMENLTDILSSGIEVKHSFEKEGLDKFADSFSEISQKLTNPNVNLKIDTQSLLQVGSIIMLLGAGINLFNSRTKTNGVILGAAILFAGSQHGPIDCDFSHLMRSDTKPQFSSGDVTSVVTSVVTLLCGYTCVKAPSDGLIKALTGSLSNYGRQLDSLDKILKWCVKAIESCVNIIRRYVLGTTSIVLMETDRDDLNALLERVRVLDDRIHLNQFMYTLDNSNLVHVLYQDCVKMQAKLTRDRDSAGLSTALNNAIAYLYKLKTKLDNMNLNLDGIRQEPCSILMRGPPGMGKSQAMEHLCMRMLPHLLPEDKVEQAMKTPGHFIYNRQAENVYWEGYDYEKVITQFDDIGQARDIQGNPDNEIMNVIRAINIFQYNVHMAGIENKGNIKFYSKMVVANTNMKTFEFNSIISPEAFFRRFDIIVDVVPKLEHCTPESRSLDVWLREIDFSTLPIGCEGITSMHPSFLEFHTYDYKLGRYNGNVYSFDQIIEKMQYFNTLKNKRFSQYQKELRNTPQVDWSTIMPKVHSYKFDSTYLDSSVKEFIEKFIKNEDYLHCSGMLCSAYHRRTGFDHKLEYIIAVYLLANPKFSTAYSWSFLEMAEFLLAEDENITDIPVFGLTYDSSIYSSLKTTYDSFVLRHTEVLTTKYPKLVTLAKVLVPVGIVVTIFAGIYSFTRVSEKGQSEYNARSKPTTKTYSKPPSMKYASALVSQPQSLMSHDKSNYEIVNKIVSRNVYELILPGNTTRCGFATFIKGNVFMVNRHFVSLCIAHIEDSPEFIDEVFVLSKPETDIKFKIPMSAICNFKVTDALDDQDVAFILAPSFVPQHTNIIKYFMPRDEIHKFKDLIFRLIINAEEGYRSWTGQAKVVDSVAVSDTTVPYSLRKGYRYMATTEDGDCGSLFTLSNVHSGAKKVLGIHSAGNPSGFGYSAAVFEEDLEEVIKLFDEQIQVDFECDTYPQCKLPLMNKMFAPLYQHKLRAKRGSGTNIRKSLLHGKILPVTTGISRSSPYMENGVKVDPLDFTLNKYCKNQTYINQQIVDDIADQLYADLCTTSLINRERRVLSFEEAVLGIENDPVFKSISRSTSPGFPFCWEAKGAGKTYWFGKDQDFDLTSPACIELKAKCLECLELANKGIRIEHIFADNPKDETLPLEKIAKKKLREFNASPLVLFIVTRMLYGSFVAWYSENKIYNGSAVGVNPYSAEWDQISRNLQQFGTGSNKGAGDYAVFDGSQISQVLTALNNRVIQKWYREDGFSLARTVIFLEVTNSKHVYENYVYEWVASLPSGHPLTTTLNNLYNHFCFRYCWLASHDFKTSCLPLFIAFVYLIVLGDDNAFSVHAEKVEIFNLLSIEKHMLDIGMTYTSDDKETVICDMKTLDEITFLKRSFTFNEIVRRYTAPLNINSITDMLDWTNKNDPISTTESNVAIALKELSLHSVDVFQTLSRKILTACVEEGVQVPNCASYRICLLTVCEKLSYY